MNDFPECDALPPLRRRLCRGELTTDEFLQIELAAGLRTEWTVRQPSRGLGDVVAKFTHATGLDVAAKALLGPDCGCPERQAALNALVPFSRKEA